MKLWVFFAAAVTAYLVGSINPAIIISRAHYRADVRGFGSHNPGFTNFMRVFGNDHAWTVFLVDFSKSAILCAFFGWLFGRVNGTPQLGAAFTALFTLLGHAYPVWYHFQGGKGVAVMFAAMWLVDWRADVVILVIFLAVMAATRYMSLSVLCAGLSAPISLAILGTESVAVWALVTASDAFMIWRHRENIRRLLQGTESKFSLKKKKDGSTPEP